MKKHQHFQVFHTPCSQEFNNKYVNPIASPLSLPTVSLSRSQRKMCWLTGVWDSDSEADDAALHQLAAEAQAVGPVWAERDREDLSGSASGPLPSPAEPDWLIWGRPWDLSPRVQRCCHLQHAPAVPEGSTLRWIFVKQLSWSPFSIQTWISAHRTCIITRLFFNRSCSCICPIWQIRLTERVEENCRWLLL